jgi:hypothetical protein
MGKLVLSMILGLGMLSSIAQAEAGGAREVFISINDVFVPSEAKSNGDSYVVVNGMYPNSCYRWSRSEVAHPSEFKHSVRLAAMVSEGMCLMVLVPYNKEISLGQLSPGEHTLRFVNGDETYFERTLTIK